MSGNKGKVLLQAAKAQAYNEDGSTSVKVRILFDNGSQRTYITNNLQRKLGLTPKKSESIQLNTFGDNKFRKQTCSNVQLVLENSSGEKIDLTALSVPVICSPLPPAVDVDYPHLEGLELADPLDEDNESRIDILIGSDFYWNIVTGDIIRGGSGPIAVRSKLGWLLTGPSEGYVSSDDKITSNLIIAGESDDFLTVNERDSLTDSLKQFWQTESIGIFDPESNDDLQRNKFFEDIQFNGTRYEVGLPWKDGCRPDSNHYGLCRDRLRSLQKKLTKEPELLQEYENIINEQKRNGIVEEVPIEDRMENNKDKDNVGVHYMPHHGVIRTDRKTTKLRVVYDGSAKPNENKLSLNDSLQTNDKFKEKHPETSEIVDMIKDSLYVDNFVSGEDCEEKALKMYTEAKSIMSQGGFNLRKWNSNSKPLLKKINEVESDASKPTDVSIENNVVEEDQSYVKTSLDPRTPEDESHVKVLGTRWNTETDELYFNFDDLLQYANTLPVTKRSLLKITAKVYDPVGLLSPFTITMKVLFQDLCAEKLDWDDTLTGEAKDKWVLFLNHLKWLNQIRVPRCYFNGHMQPLKIQLHGFSDASKRAYGAVVYMRSVYEDGHIDVRLISSKTKVAPIKQQSIPRLELLGATILVRIVNTVKNAIPFAKEIEIVYWTDSLTTLFWIKSNKVWKQYVRHRVEEILKLTSKEEWRFCPGKLNPADIPSRGLKGQELVESKIWWNGPEFLYNPETEWPTSPEGVTMPDKDACTEMAKEPLNISHSLVNANVDCATADLNQIIDCCRYNSFGKLVRITACTARKIGFTTIVNL